mgnify:FL=1
MSMKDDMRKLDNLANAYHNCQNGFRAVWKQKWYKMVQLIAERVPRTVDKSKQK